MTRARFTGLACAAIAGIAVITWTIASREPDLSNVSVTTIRALARELDSVRQRLRIPGMSLAIAEGGRLTWAHGLGQAHVEKAIPAGPDTIYHLASVTKPFGTTVVLQLVEEGRLQLDAPLSGFGINMKRSAPVRVWHVMSHTSRDPPGTRYRYDGSAFGILDRIVEQVTGQSFASELASRITRPLALRHTAPNPYDPQIDVSGPWAWFLGISAPTDEGVAQARTTFTDFGADRRSIESSLAMGYARRNGQWIWPAGLFGPLEPMPHPTSLFAGGGLVASAPDVARFSVALDEHRLLSAETLGRAYTPIVSPSGEVLPYGLGWFVQQYQGTKLVWHHGQSFEASSLIVKIPERRITFVALANSDGLSRWRRLGDHGDVLASPVAVLFLNWLASRKDADDYAKVSTAGHEQNRLRSP
jgi:CubicO group peptidase (beta-lactamase class C family)